MLFNTSTPVLFLKKLPPMSCVENNSFNGELVWKVREKSNPRVDDGEIFGVCVTLHVHSSIIEAENRQSGGNMKVLYFPKRSSSLTLSSIKTKVQLKNRNGKLFVMNIYRCDLTDYLVKNRRKNIPYNQAVITQWKSLTATGKVFFSTFSLSSINLDIFSTFYGWFLELLKL